MAALLNVLNDREESEYFSQVLNGGKANKVKVKQTTDGRGKGLFALQDFQVGEVIFKEEPLAAIQHSVSKEDCLNCSRCCRFLGPIELQVAWKLRSSGCISKKVLTELRTDRIELPFSKQYPLPRPVTCRGRCEDFYCSKECEQQDWEDHHSLLCTGEASPSSSFPEKFEAVENLIDHAHETNDIFLLAAKVIASVLCEARALYKNTLLGASSKERHQQALLRAWQPWAAGWRKLWWESVAVPNDVTDETAFRAELKNLAVDSLELLKAGIFDEDYQSLFDLEVFGYLVGMFELNNMGLSIPSPVQQWLDNLPEPEQGQTGCLSPSVLTENMRQALEESLEESSTCEGTGFYTILSCANHSCSANASLECKENSQITLKAQQSITTGDEICINYIGEELDLQDRQEALRDYGFVCKCDLCQIERQQS